MAGYVCCSLLKTGIKTGLETGLQTGFPTEEVTRGGEKVRLTRQPVRVEAGSASSSSPGCGQRATEGVRGRVASREGEGGTQLGQYPWHAAILKREEVDNLYVCGGSLLDSQHILTAAHCLGEHTTEELRVRLGEWDVNSDAEFYPNLEYKVEEVVIHPQYQSNNLYNDLAVLKLSSRVDTDQHPHIGPICLPHHAQIFAGRRCYVSGWGKDVFGPNGTYHSTLKEVDVPVLLDFDCERKLKQTRLGSDFILHPGFLCAGGEEGKDACKGDGGGPLACLVEGSWVLSVTSPLKHIIIIIILIISILYNSIIRVL